jgi:hypothetical protein
MAGSDHRLSYNVACVLRLLVEKYKENRAAAQQL